MDDRMQVRPCLVNAHMERILRGWRVQAFTLPFGGDSNNMLSTQATFIESRRRDPHVTGFIPHGDVATGGCCHLMRVDALHDFDDLVAWMKIRKRSHC